MEKKNNNKTIIIVVITVIVLIGCLCLSAGALGVYFLNHRIDKNNEELIYETAVPETSPEDQTALPEVTPDNETDGTEINNTEITQKQQEIIKRAEKIRGLKAQGDFNITFLTKEELRDQLINDMYRDTTKQDFQDEHDILTLLGFIPAEMDLESFYLDFYTEQIAGYYDEDANVMYLIKGGSETDNSLTLAHEYTHFLQFDHFNPAETLNYNDEYCEKNQEYCFVLGSVFEGDATLTEMLLAAQPDLGLYDERMVEQDTSVFDNAPQYFQNYLLFPYTYGFDFVSSVYRKGGFSAVNDLYSNPPLSAEQIMHPEKYSADQPVNVLFEPFQKNLDESCDLVYNNVLNEADLLWLLNSGYEKSWRISDKSAKNAAAGWGGGAFQFARCDGKPMFFGKTVWDTINDAKEFSQSLKDYNDKRWGKSKINGSWTGTDGEQIYVSVQDDKVFYMIAPAEFSPDSLIDLIETGQGL